MTPTRIIKSLFQALGLLNRGRFEVKCDTVLTEALDALAEHPDEKCEATITIEVKLTKLGDRIDIKPSVKTKLPAEKGFPSTAFWPLADGLSVQHPSQTDMFGPQPVPERRTAADVIA